MAQSQTTADELRKVAAYLQDQADAAAEATPAPPLVIGDAQRFPQPAPEDRVLAHGSVSSETDQTIETLLTLAATMDAGGDVSPVLLADVQPAIDAYRAEQS